MPYTQEELKNYQWYQDRIKARQDEYNSYLSEAQKDQEDNEVKKHTVDENGTLLSFENINEEVRLKEPFRRAGLDTPTQRIIRANQYPVLSRGQKFNITIDTDITQLIQKPTSLPRVRVFDAPNLNLLDPKVNVEPDSDGTITSALLLTPSRKTPNERTDGFTIDLVNGDIIAAPNWNSVVVDTAEEQIENYLEVYYLENNFKRQIPNINILNSYIGELLSTFIEYEIIVVEKEDLDLIPNGTPLGYNTR